MTKPADQDYMAACLRLARRHRGLTGTNPAVGTLLVRDGVILGKGITAKGGRPHAERIAIDQAGGSAKGATAYVSLEPCAHHGATPPCAQALINAGVTRVVTAWTDPDNRVDGKGHAMLREVGIAVECGCVAETAATDLAGYLNRKQNNRPQVILKLAVSKDGKLGIAGHEVAMTGARAKSYVHRMRAEYEAILVGRGTVESDDPELTCRLIGLTVRSPHRYILDTNATLSPTSKLAQSANDVPVSVITARSSLEDELTQQGVRYFAAETHDGRLALPEVLEDMGAAGISTLMVEGGAETARSFLDAGLVDEIALFTGAIEIGEAGIPSPLSCDIMPKEFKLTRKLKLADDTLHIYRKA
ncbi:MAG: bifunctional diaminohydroxyphosphoribosylaminopyrimidine deaminase/5-amino-6-(5-phosphoribosylamino)uracil reductase RibD [Rhizobiaceae bacterium]